MRDTLHSWCPASDQNFPTFISITPSKYINTLSILFSSNDIGIVAVLELLKSIPKFLLSAPLDEILIIYISFITTAINSIRYRTVDNLPKLRLSDQKDSINGLFYCRMFMFEGYVGMSTGGITASIEYIISSYVEST